MGGRGGGRGTRVTESSQGAGTEPSASPVSAGAQAAGEARPQHAPSMERPEKLGLLHSGSFCGGPASPQAPSLNRGHGSRHERQNAAWRWPPSSCRLHGTDGEPEVGSWSRLVHTALGIQTQSPHCQLLRYSLLGILQSYA